MADISKVAIGSTEYNIKDSEARTAIDNINSFEYVVCTSADNTPEGAPFGATGTTGQLTAAANLEHTIYLVPAESGESGHYDSYIVANISNAYVWVKMGDSSSGIEVVRLTDSGGLLPY